MPPRPPDTSGSASKRGEPAQTTHVVGTGLSLCTVLALPVNVIREFGFTPYLGFYEYSRVFLIELFAPDFKIRTPMPPPVIKSPSAGTSGFKRH